MKTLSIKTHCAYAICAGIKDVENRTWKTNYRGDLLIHSSGSYSYFDIEYNDFIFDKNEIKIAKNFENQMIESEKNKIKFDFSKLPDWINKLYDFLIDIDEFYIKNPNTPFFKNQAIIGKVTLIDIITDSQSPFAEKNCYHWILKNPVLFKTPTSNIKGKLKLFDFDENLLLTKI